MCKYQKKSRAIPILKNNKGVVLLFTLVMVGVLTVLTLGFARQMNQEISFVQNSVDSVKAYALAQGGINYATVLLKEDEEAKYDWLGESWAEEKELQLEEGVLRISIVDEERKINLNCLVPPPEEGKKKKKKEKEEEGNHLRIDQMFELCENLRLDHSLIPCIIDWIDKDTEVTVLEFVEKENEGAEEEYYQELDFSYPCADTLFLVKREVLMVKGMDKEVFYGRKEEKGLGEFITIYGGGEVNVNTASEEVLASTFQTFIPEALDDWTLQEIIEYRKVEPFGTLSELKDFLSSKAVDNMVKSKFIALKSNIFTITSWARVGEVERKIIAVVEREGSKLIVRYWEEI